MNSIRKALIAASALTAVAIPAQANAASFVLNGLSSIQSSSARNGFTAAANYWSSVLKDDATVIINRLPAGFDGRRAVRLPRRDLSPAGL